MKQLIYSLLRRCGFEVRLRRIRKPGSPGRPIGDMVAFLEDVKARGFLPRTVMDVGANRGDWSRMARKVFPAAAFVLIEPQPEMRPLLDSFCRDFPDCQWIEAGAAAEHGELMQTIWEDFAGSSFLPQPDQCLVTSGRQRSVRMITLDSMLDKIGGPPDLVKLDIQGFELEALKGATTLFGKTELFIIEVSLFSFLPGMPLLRDVVSFMGDRKYELYDLPGHLRRPCEGSLGQLDLAFTKAKGVLRQHDNW